MLRFLAMLTFCLTAFSLAAGTIAHASEAPACLAGEVIPGFGDIDGHRDQLPAEDSNAAPHQHSGCHGHHVATATDVAMPFAVFQFSGALLPASLAGLPYSTGYPALRPPIA